MNDDKLNDEQQPESATTKQDAPTKRKLFVPEVLDLRAAPIPAPAVTNDPHDRWFRKVK